MSARDDGQPITTYGQMGRFRAALSVEAPDWYRWAACAQTDPEVFFPLQGARGVVQQAKIICAGCDVQAKCLERALGRNELYGIYGGTTPLERKRIRARRNREKREVAEEAS